MTMEMALSALLGNVCGQAFPDEAPAGTNAPYVVWQGAGGRTLRYVDATPADKRNTLMLVRVWSTTRLECMALARAVEDALCASGDFTVDPKGEPTALHEPDTGLYGSNQYFSIWSAR